jgi:hypothetical protein
MIEQFVRDLFPKAKFTRMFNAREDGWWSQEFYIKCVKMGATLSIVETTKGFIFGLFTTCEWDVRKYVFDASGGISFVFSVNDRAKYMLRKPYATAIVVSRDTWGPK